MSIEISTVKQLILNRIRTPDGTVLTSYGRHDYKTHLDSVSQEVYMIDGGLDYLRRNTNQVDYEELSVYSDAPYEVIRESLHWGSRGIHGDQPLEYKALKTLTTEHIAGIIKTQHQLPQWLRDIFEKELAHRPTSQELKRIRQMYARHGDLVQFKLWKENETLVVSEFPDLITAIAQCNEGMEQLTTAVKELVSVTSSS